MDSDYADWALQSDPPPTNAPSPPVHTGAPVSDDDSAADSAEDRAIAGFKCTEDQRKWIINEHYGDYLTHKRRRGSRNGPNAKTFSYELVYTFEAQFFSSWPETKRVKYRSKIQSVIYNLFNNHFAHDNDAQKEWEATKTKPEGKKKVNAENLWSSSNKSTVDQAVEKHLKGNPKSTRNAGTTRHVVCKEFKKLPNDEKLMWMSKAAEARAFQKLDEPLTGKELTSYCHEWMSRLNRLVLEGQWMARMSMNAIVTWEVQDEQGGNGSAYQMDTYVSKDVEAYKDSQEFADGLEQYSKWYRDFKGMSNPLFFSSPITNSITGATVRGCDPGIAVIPDPSNHNLPKMPDLPEQPTLMLLRNLNCQFVNAEYSFMGGVGAAPWKKIEADSYKGEFNKWVQPGRWPDGLDVKDPSSMNLANSLRTYHQLRKRQDGAAKAEIFQFQRVFGGTTSSTCTASRKTLVDHCGRKVWMFEFDDYQEKSPSTRPIAYSETSWKYYYFVTKRGGLEHWVGLPRVPDSPVVQLFLPDSIAFVEKLLEPADSSLCNEVTGLMETVNKIEFHAPATTRNGIWGLTGDVATLPKLIPSSKPDDVVSAINSSLLSFWLEESYFMTEYIARSKGHGANASAGHLEYWFEGLQDSSLIHRPSKTVQGGECGVVWVVLALVKSLLNASVTALGVTPPTSAPADRKLERFGKGEFYKLLECFNIWKEVCADSLATLSKTSSERIHVADSEGVPTSPQPSPSPDDGDAPVTSQKKPAGSKKTKSSSKQAKSSKGKSKLFSELDKSDSEDHGDSDAVSLDDNAQKKQTTATARPFVLDKTLFKAASPSPDAPPENRKNIFGLFGAQPDILDFTGTLQQLIDASKNALKECQSAIIGWNALNVEYKIPYPSGAVSQADRLVKQDHPIRKPLAAVVLLHRFDFNRARSFWPTVKLRHQAVLLQSRKSAKIQKAIEDRLDLGHKDLPLPGRKQLENLLARLKAKLWVCRAIIEQVRDLEGLSTERANDLQDAWNKNPLLMGTNDLLELCHALGEWRDKTYTVLRDQQNYFIYHWSKHNLYDYEELPSRMVYTFGCPGINLIGGKAHMALEANPRGVRVLSPEPVDLPNPSNPNTGLTGIPEPVVPSEGEGLVDTTSQPINEALESSNAGVANPDIPNEAPQPIVPTDPSTTVTPANLTEATSAVDPSADKDAVPEVASTTDGLQGGGDINAADDDGDAALTLAKEFLSTFPLVVPASAPGGSGDATIEASESTHPNPAAGPVEESSTPAGNQSAPMADHDTGATEPQNRSSQLVDRDEQDASGNDQPESDSRAQALGGGNPAGHAHNTRQRLKGDGIVVNKTGGNAGGDNRKKAQKNARKRKADAMDAVEEDDGFQSHLQTPGAGGSSAPARELRSQKPNKPVSKKGRK